MVDHITCPPWRPYNFSSCWMMSWIEHFLFQFSLVASLLHYWYNLCWVNILCALFSGFIMSSIGELNIFNPVSRRDWIQYFVSLGSDTYESCIYNELPFILELTCNCYVRATKSTPQSLSCLVNFGLLSNFKYLHENLVMFIVIVVLQCKT